MADVNAHDLEAIGDIADWLIEESDGLSAEKAIELLIAARAASAKLKLAIDMLEAQALKSIEQPILIGNTAWTKKRVFKKRPDQMRIAAAVVALAILDKETGEQFEAERSAERAVQLMRGLFVSPSTVPKVSGVQNLGLEMDDVCRAEHTGWELRGTELD